MAQINELLKKILSIPLENDLIVVGGQALVVWELMLDMPQNTQTRDIDFLGGSMEGAKKLAKYLNAKLIETDIDDFSPNQSVIIKDDIVLVDFLWTVQGLDKTKIDQRKININIAPFDCSISVLHPMDCLLSKISNYMTIPTKRTPQGLKQAQSSISILNAFLIHELKNNNEKYVIKEVNNLFKMAQSAEYKRFFKLTNTDILDAVPDLSFFKNKDFIEKNYARKKSYTEKKRNPSPNF